MANRSTEGVPKRLEHDGPPHVPGVRERTSNEGKRPSEKGVHFLGMLSKVPVLLLPLT